MTSYINQTIARQHVADLIAEAEAGRLRRQFRRARRAERAARRSVARSRRRPSNVTLTAPHRIGLVGLS